MCTLHVTEICEVESAFDLDYDCVRALLYADSAVAAFGCLEFSEAILKSKDSGVEELLEQDRPYNPFQQL